MLTDKCQTTIEEVLTVADKSQLSAGSMTHIESCLACRRSLEAITALSASVESVLPLENNVALKQKIASKLEATMQGRRAISNQVSSGTAKASLYKTALSALIVLGTGAALFLGAIYCLGSTSNKAAEKPNRDISLSNLKSNSISEITTTKENTKENNNQNEADKEIFKDGYDGDLRNLKPKKFMTQEIPSPIKE